MLIAILVIIGLSVLILGHEAGHFFVAKLFGMKIDEFGFGFPPRIFGARKYTGEHEERIGVSEEIDVEVEELHRGKTDVVKEIIIEKIKEVDELRPVSKWLFFWRDRKPENEVGGLKGNDAIYSVNFFPFGGFVKIAGENDPSLSNESKGQASLETNISENDKKRLFSFQRPWKKFSVIAAGIVVNFIIGWFLLSLVLMVGTPKALVISQIQPNSPAAKVGLLSGDVIKNYDNAQEFISFTDSHRGEEISLTIARNGKDMNLNVTPRLKTGPNEGAIGVEIIETGDTRRGFFGAIWNGLKESLFIAGLTLAAFYNLIKNLVFSGSLMQGIVGPVGIFSMAQETGHIGLIYLVQLISLISINLAVINFFPFPALDGGRLLLIVVEKIKGSPISRRIEMAINGIGFALLILLMVLLTVRDVGGLF